MKEFAQYEDMAARLRASEAQLECYARDLRKLLEAERSKSAQLEAANRQLQIYARDVNRAFEAEQERRQELENAHHATLLRLLRASRFKDNETAAHLRRIQRLTGIVAKELGWSPEETKRIEEASPMHDVGKIGVPDSILHKKGPLDAAEWAIMKRHPAFGGLLLQGSGSPLLEMAREIAWAHHERWDGTGYPRGLKGKAIPESARIVAVADVYDALRTERAYKPGYSHSRCCEIILQGDGRTMPQHFAPEVLSAFRDLQSKFEACHDRHYH